MNWLLWNKGGNEKEEREFTSQRAVLKVHCFPGSIFVPCPFKYRLLPSQSLWHRGAGRSELPPGKWNLSVETLRAGPGSWECPGTSSPVGIGQAWKFLKYGAQSWHEMPSPGTAVSLSTSASYSSSQLPSLNRSLGIQSAQLIWKGLAAKDRNSGISLWTKIVAFPLHTKQPHGLNIIHKRRLLWQTSTQLRKYKYFEGNHSLLWVRAGGSLSKVLQLNRKEKKI